MGSHGKRALLVATALLVLGGRTAAQHAVEPAVDPPREGLVLWLDASEASTIDLDAQGRVERWRNRQGATCEAMQPLPANRPRFLAEDGQSAPRIAFGGSAFLQLAGADLLNFRPGECFTMAVAYHLEPGRCGTFLAKGGGEEKDRAWQFYAAPGRIGAIAYGSRRSEIPLDTDAQSALLVCDGRRCRVWVEGREVLAFTAGAGSSAADILIGARRATADNRGTTYPLEGCLAKILVYDRALAADELGRLFDYLQKKSVPEDLRTLASRDVFAAAERLWRTSQTGRLDDDQASLAAEMLNDDDWFVRGLAEWALATRVGADNNGEHVVWTGDEDVDWFRAYCRRDAAYRLRADYVRQAIALGIHHDSAALLRSAREAIGRAESVIEEMRRSGASERTLAEAEREWTVARHLVDRLAEATASGSADALADCRRLWLEVRLALRPVVLAHPAIDFDSLVFTTRHAAHTARNITRSFAWKHKPGGDICILQGFRGEGRVQPVLQGRLGPGYVWGLDLWWDGDRVVFSFARQPSWPPALSTVAGETSYELRRLEEPLHLFEASLDGEHLRQLTDDGYWNDFEPTYCADGRIVFVSDRCARSAQCGSFVNDIPNPNLYVMDADGSHVRQLTDNKDLDRYPHALDDGRIAYTHWEYQERHFMEVHSIWTIRPDGTMSDALFKHHMPAPCALRDTRSVPESSRLVAVATGHHTFAEGPIVLVDPRWGTNHPGGLSIVTPGVVPQEGAMAGQPVPEGGVPDAGGLYRNPWALSEKCFLAAYAYPRVGANLRGLENRADSNGFGLYMIDVFGNKELLHRDPVLSASIPIPWKPRRRPPILPDAPARADIPPRTAECYVADVYEGLDGIPRGAVKYLRIAQHVGWPWDPNRGAMPYLPNHAYQRQFGFWSWSPVRVIGTVPVEADGSASFVVPADTAVYFQALDERQMEIRRMRSMVSFKQGETRGCRGCHETTAKTPAASQPVPMAVRDGQRIPQPPPWGSDRLLGYEWLVQPLLDAHCVRCHGEEQPEGGLDFSGRLAESGFYQSFHTMFGARSNETTAGESLVSVADRFSNSSVTAPKEFGSHRSPLVRVLLDDPLHVREVKMTDDQWEALVTWVDANAPYHDRFYDKRPLEGEPSRSVTPPLEVPFAVEAAAKDRPDQGKPGSHFK